MEPLLHLNPISHGRVILTQQIFYRVRKYLKLLDISYLSVDLRFFKEKKN